MGRELKGRGEYGSTSSTPGQRGGGGGLVITGVWPPRLSRPPLLTESMLGETASRTVKLPCSQEGSERRSQTPGTFCHWKKEKERRVKMEKRGCRKAVIGCQWELTSSFRPTLQHKAKKWPLIGCGSVWSWEVITSCSDDIDYTTETREEKQKYRRRRSVCRLRKERSLTDA